MRAAYAVWRHAYRRQGIARQLLFGCTLQLRLRRTRVRQ